jgi:hypothetical protein
LISCPVLRSSSASARSTASQRMPLSGERMYTYPRSVSTSDPPSVVAGCYLTVLGAFQQGHRMRGGLLVLMLVRRLVLARAKEKRRLGKGRGYRKEEERTFWENDMYGFFANIAPVIAIDPAQLSDSVSIETRIRRNRKRDSPSTDQLPLILLCPLFCLSTRRQRLPPLPLLFCLLIENLPPRALPE